MPNRPRRAAALVAGVATTLLLVPATANAALGGANALTTSLRPDLRSATVQSTNAVDDTTTVRVCFSKAIASLPQAIQFQLRAYADDDGFGFDGITATSATRSTSNCADAVFPNDDATQFTAVTVGGSDGTAPDSGTSGVSTNGFGNIQDSTALIGSKTNNGTRGFGTGPDLVGITVNNAAATIDYTFDQRVAGIVAGVGDLAGGFSYNTSDGTPVNSLPSAPGVPNRAISADGLTVRVNFPPGPQIQDAVRAVVGSLSVVAKTPSNGGTNGLRSAARPGSGGFTDRPDLIAVTLAADGSSVDYQYDQVLTGFGAGAFLIGLSSSNEFPPGGAPVIVGGAGVGNTVRVPITALGGGSTFNELITFGGATIDAVRNGGLQSTAGGLPAGGNAGAFATGFLTGPDALKVSFDNATDVAHVLFDQRWIAADPTAFKLLDDQGSQIAGAAISVSGTGAPTAGQTTADVTFPAGTLVGARSLLIQQGAVTQIGSFEAATQVISPTAPASRTAKKFRPAKVLSRAAVRRAMKRR